MTKNMSNSPESIINRLEKLRKWQEEQQRILLERQNSQRVILSLEHQKMYDIWGLSTTNNGNSHEFKNLSKIDNNISQEEGVALLDSIELTRIDKDEKHTETDEMLPPKKPFLKRGQGLMNRFKIDPNALRLDNLPKYKYANTHKKFSKNKNNKNKIINKIEEAKEITSATMKEMKANGTQNSVVKEKELNTHNFFKPFLELKKDPDKKCQSFKTLEVSEGTKTKDQQNNDKIEMITSSISTKSSTIKKSSLLESENTSISSKGNQSECTTIEPISWAQVLDTENPIPVQHFRHNSSSTKSQDDSIGLFELLEKQADNSNISLNISNLRKWIATKSSLFGDSQHQDEMDTFSTDHVTSTISPVPFDIENKIILDESEDNKNDKDYNDKRHNDDNDDDDDETTSESSGQRKSPKGHVRFSDDVEINELESDTETILSNELDEINNSKTSTPTDKILFQQFKARLFGDVNFAHDDNTNDSTLIEDKKLIDEQKSEILEKTKLLKSRLVELENEISSFKQHNVELIKLKQQHELDKVQIEQEKIDMQEKLNDERIKIEIYLHDERMKIEEEKKKLEKIINAQKTPNRREREEITRLKEQVENLQKENKSKENRHVAAQSRLRAQIRILEKEVKDLSFETEHLKKEIKKLESENSKLNRMNNNKMLQEINKTISKLAPKVEAIKVNNKNPKPVVAKVISHKQKQLNIRKSSQSKSTPNLSRTEKNNLISEEDSDNDSDDNDDGHSNDNSSEISTSETEQSQYFSKMRNGKRKPDSSKNIDKDTNENGSKTVDNISIKLRREILNTDGSKDIWYPNGNLKKISADGMIIKMLYFNKDIKETNITEGTIKYYYAETNTWHTTYLDGLEILEFPNGQTEHRYKDGTIEVHFPNGSIRISNSADEKKTEEWRYPDGTTLVHLKNGDKILSLPNGQKEIHTKLQKRREYPDGTVKIVYPDGSQETRYSNGRVRLKDKLGNLVMDSEDSNY